MDDVSFCPSVPDKPPHVKPARGGSFIYLHYALFALALVLLWFLLYHRGFLWVKPGDLAGGDTYMRLTRVIQLYDTGLWYDAVSHRSNAPLGETLHWTRPLDLLLLAGAWLLSPVCGFAEALFQWAIMIGPFLQILTLVALAWGVSPILARPGLSYLPYIFLSQFYLFVMFQAGRPDHHCLLLFLFTMSFGYTLRLLLFPYAARWACPAGMVSALAVWVSVESLVPLAVNLIVLGLMWVVRREDFSAKNLAFCLTLAVALGLALMLERPRQELLVVEFDRLSVFHVFLGGSLALVCLALRLADNLTSLGRQTLTRLAMAMGSGALLLLGVWSSFPKFFQGPFADVDPRIIPVWLDKVGELKPLFIPQVGLTGLALVLFIPAAAGIFGALALAVWDRRRGNRPWLYVLFSLLVFAFLAQHQRRWITYAEILFTIVASELLCRAFNRLDLRLSSPFRPLARFFLAALLCLGLWNLDLFVKPLVAQTSEPQLPLNIPLNGLCRFLNNRYGSGNSTGKPRRILTHIHSGPEILYRTPCEVIGTPYHRNAAGILFTYEVMTALTDEAAYALVKKRNINLIILCISSNEAEIFTRADGQSTLYQRLRQGQVPAWLKGLPLPPELASSFRIFEVLP
jgi:hypothetical protein